jgi:hypothetical protein
MVTYTSNIKSEEKGGEARGRKREKEGKMQKIIMRRRHTYIANVCELSST